MSNVVYFNGRFVPYEDATIHVEDRGNVFADGVYEVVRYYGGRGFKVRSHMQRLQRSAEEVRLNLPHDVDTLAAVADDTIRRNGLHEATLYVQLTRGTAPRLHAFPPADIPPTLFMIARQVTADHEPLRRAGVSCVSVEDRRWKMCHVKSIGLLPNVLARQQANEAGAFEALFVRDGIVTEGSGSNFFAVIGKSLRTHPDGPYILSGVTRRVVLDLAERLRIRVDETPFTLAELRAAKEAFLTGTTIEVLPVVAVDGQPVGDGNPGHMTIDLAEAYRARTRP